MKQYKKSHELKNEAKDKLDGKYAPCVLICLSSVMFQYIVTLLISLFLPNTGTSSLLAEVIQIIASLLIAWVMGVMNLGLSFFFLKAACGQPCMVSDLFYGYQNDFSKALSISGVYALLSAVCEMPYQYLAQKYILSWNLSYGIAALVSGVLGLCAYFLVSAGMFLSYYLILDFPDKSAKEIIALSFRLMKGSKRRIIYITFSFVPLMVLCICSLYIGFLWLMPYMQMTNACFFLDIMNPKEV